MRHLASLSICWLACSGSGPDDCAAKCGGCCSAGQCRLGTDVAACGQQGESCDVCVGSQACVSGRCTFAAAGGGSAGGGSGGGSCVPQTCGSQGKNCDSIPNGCGGDVYCGACSAPDICGGSGTANVCGAVFVLFEYERVTRNAGPGSTCPPTFTFTTCMVTQPIARANLSRLQLVYGTCTTTQTAADGYTIDCTNNCTYDTSSCQLPSGNFQNYQHPLCRPPMNASDLGCAWFPPP